MSTDRVRAVALGLMSVGLIVASVLVMEWFVVRIANDPSGIDKITFDLRAIRVCQNNLCVIVELSQVPLLSRLGVYSSLAPATFWTSAANARLVQNVAGARLE